MELESTVLERLDKSTVVSVVRLGASEFEVLLDSMELVSTVLKRLDKSTNSVVDMLCSDSVRCNNFFFFGERIELKVVQIK